MKFRALEGMTHKRAMDCVRSLNGVRHEYYGESPFGGGDSLEVIRALATVGAHCVGAGWQKETRWECAKCGLGVSCITPGRCDKCDGPCLLKERTVIVLPGVVR